MMSLCNGFPIGGLASLRATASARRDAGPPQIPLKHFYEPANFPQEQVERDRKFLPLASPVLTAQRAKIE